MRRFVLAGLLGGFTVAANGQEAQLPASVSRPPTNPVLVKTHHVQYTKAALDAKVEGNVVLTFRIGTDGLVEYAEVRKSLDKQYGLDEQAMFAISKWIF